MTLFSRIVIIGVGLIGGSLGLALKKRRLTHCVVGVDHNAERLQTALRLGVVDKITSNFEEGINAGIDTAPENAQPDTGAYNPSSLPAAELIIVATPVSLIAKHVQQAASAVQTTFNYRNVLITDVGSTKEMICNRLEHTTLPNDCRFIGSHPIAGKEKSGVEYADADIFENKLAVITPTASARDRDIGTLVRFWRSLGSLTASMSPVEHDRTLARTSHLPHLLSALLADRLHLPDAKYMGTGYHSTTRLASGLPELWRDIVSQNAEAILEAIRDYETALRDLREKIERNDWEAVAQFLENAKRNRDTLAVP